LDRFVVTLAACLTRPEVALAREAVIDRNDLDPSFVPRHDSPARFGESRSVSRSRARRRSLTAWLG
jgi:hypothetical protein